MTEQISKKIDGIMSGAVSFTDVDDALQYLCDLYAKNVSNLYTRNPAKYPYIAASIVENGVLQDYGTTVSHPEELAEYYKTQFKMIIEDFQAPIWIGLSSSDMSLALIDEELFSSLAGNAHLPCMDKIRNGCDHIHAKAGIKQLGKFQAERIGYSLNRLHHYCGTDSRYFQNTVVFVNYQVYCDLFMDYACKQVDQGYYTKAIGPNIKYTTANGLQKTDLSFTPPMPAYHLVAPNRGGITFINTNVGPSNIKTITDHIAVMNSHRWIMLGHCAGLCENHKVGDYIIGTEYLRNDYVLDRHVCKELRIPVCQEMKQSFEHACGANNVHFGTIATTCDRNWELDANMVNDFLAAKTVAVDMESATLAANAFRFNVNSLSFLCVSDMPLHGAPKLRKMARKFYDHKVIEHLEICMEGLIDKNPQCIETISVQPEPTLRSV